MTRASAGHLDNGLPGDAECTARDGLAQIRFHAHALAEFPERIGGEVLRPIAAVVGAGH